MSFLGIDIGSSAIKGMIVNENGCIIEFSRVQTEHFSPQPGWFEMEPENIFKVVLNLIDSISSKVKKYDPIRSISFSCLGTAFFPVDKIGNPLYRAISSLDKRSIKYLGWLEKKGIDSFDVYKISGQPRNIVSFLHNLIWLKKHLGRDFKKIYKFLSLKDYIISRLGLGQHTDFTQASRTMLYDFKAKKWSGYICNAIDLDFDLLPEIVKPFEPLGININTKICGELSLPKKVTISSGVHDSESCVVGSNFTGIEDILITLGTYEEATINCERFNPNLKNYQNNIIIEENALDGLVINYTTFQTGLLLEWLRKIFFSDMAGNLKADFDEIFRSCSEEINNIIINPNLLGSNLLSEEKSIKKYNNYGFITGLMLNDSKNNIIKSFIEGINFNIRKIIELLDISVIEKVFTVGGGAQSDFFIQNKCDILNKKICSLKITESGAYGAAIIAALASGFGRNFNELFSIFKNEIAKEYFPDNKKVEKYNKKFKKFTKFSQKFCK
ncbi:MAG: FGGY family carbohydrate kinase [Actinobacteria bacterium]|nr:FGGY family carbohydrate kinase [Actinomycetota bacterium]